MFPRGDFMPVGRYRNLERRGLMPPLADSIGSYKGTTFVSIPRRAGRSVPAATELAGYEAFQDAVVRGVGCMVFVGTERGPEAYAMRDFEPTPSGGKIG